MTRALEHHAEHNIKLEWTLYKELHITVDWKMNKYNSHFESENYND